MGFVVFLNSVASVALFRTADLLEERAREEHEFVSKLWSRVTYLTVIHPREHEQ